MPADNSHSLTVSRVVRLTKAQTLGVWVQASAALSWSVGVQSGFSVVSVAVANGVSAERVSSLSVLATGWTAVGGFRSTGFVGSYVVGTGFTDAVGIYVVPADGVYHLAASVRLDNALGNMRALLSIHGLRTVTSSLGQYVARSQTCE